MSDQKMNFAERVVAAQSELKAPKGQYNSFGRYKYRSAEDILEAAKPINLKHGLMLTISDRIIQVGDRYYIQATATLADTESPQAIEVTAFAREPLDKKGMDASQITGTASSYARKYALNGLYLIDDTKDADTDEYQNQNKRQAHQQQQPKQAKNCADCSEKIVDVQGVSADIIAQGTQKTYGRELCFECASKAKASKEAGND